MPFGTMMDFDVNKTLAEFDARKDAPPAQDAGRAAQPEQEPAPEPLSRAEELADNAKGDASREHELREAAGRPSKESEERMRLLNELNSGREKDAREKAARIGVPEFQSIVSSTVRGSLAMDNVQEMIAVRNQANLRKGMGKDPNESLKKAAAKGQMSTVSVPSVLLDSVRQQIGSLSSYTNQNDIMTGFLYWYFGQPEGVSFGSEQTYQKVLEIVVNLKANASPSKASELSLNMSESLLERLGSISKDISKIARLLEMISNDSIGVKTRSDKISVCVNYLVMNALMRTEPVSPYQKLEDVDLLAGGEAWELMKGIDSAYEYVRDTRGREIYKSKHGVKEPYKMPVPPSYSGRGQDQDYGADDGGDGPYRPPIANGGDDDYEDVPDGFDPLNDDFDDMGVGSDFGPPGLNDPDYEDGVDPHSEAAMRRRMAENAMIRRINAMEADSETDE